MLFVKTITLALSLSPLEGFATPSPATLPNISCGDRRFEIYVEVVKDVASLTIKGASIFGEPPVFTPKIKVDRDDIQGFNTYTFSFGDSFESAQTLVASFKIGKSQGDGVYSLVEHDFQTNMRCLLK